MINLIKFCKLIKHIINDRPDTETPSREMNAHITYHVAQAKQAKHGSLVDRGANGGLAGSDVRILSTSPRKCTVTGIDNHEIPVLDLVQCAALVQTNHGIVNLIMNEYAYYGRGHSIHSSGQIEWLIQFPPKMAENWWRYGGELVTK